MSIQRLLEIANSLIGQVDDNGNAVFCRAAGASGCNGTALTYVVSETDDELCVQHENETRITKYVRDTNLVQMVLVDNVFVDFCLLSKHRSRHALDRGRKS